MSNTRRRMVFKKPNWGPPPEGYIAGLGRGATGFITRGDIGPSRLGQTVTETAAALPGLGRGRGRGAPAAVIAQSQFVVDKQDDAPTNDKDFDTWHGYQNTRVFQQQPTESIDQNNPINIEENEADLEYAKIEEYLEGKRKRDVKAESKKVRKIQENLDQVDFQR